MTHAEILAEEETAWDALRVRIGRAWYEVAWAVSGAQEPPHEGRNDVYMDSARAGDGCDRD